MNSQEKFLIICEISMSDYYQSYQSSIKSIFSNAYMGDIKLFKDKQIQNLINNVEYVYEPIENNTECLIYAKHEDILSEVVIKQGLLKLKPLTPLKTKTGIDSPIETIDLSFYIKIMLQLVDDFEIYELHTEEIENLN